LGRDGDDGGVCCYRTYTSLEPIKKDRGGTFDELLD
jgi:hypothetical protein